MRKSNRFFYAFAWVVVTILLLLSMLTDVSELMIALKLLIIVLSALPLRREITFLEKKLTRGILNALKKLGGHMEKAEHQQYCQIITRDGTRCGHPALFAMSTIICDHDERAPYLIAGTIVFCCRAHHPNPHISKDRTSSLETEQFLKRGNATWEGIYPNPTASPTIGA